MSPHLIEQQVTLGKPTPNLANTSVDIPPERGESRVAFLKQARQLCHLESNHADGIVDACKRVLLRELDLLVDEIAVNLQRL